MWTLRRNLLLAGKGPRSSVCHTTFARLPSLSIPDFVSFQELAILRLEHIASIVSFSPSDRLYRSKRRTPALSSAPLGARRSPRHLWPRRLGGLRKTRAMCSPIRIAKAKRTACRHAHHLFKLHEPVLHQFSQKRANASNIKVHLGDRICDESCKRGEGWLSQFRRFPKMCSVALAQATLGLGCSQRLVVGNYIWPAVSSHDPEDCLE